MDFITVIGNQTVRISVLEEELGKCGRANQEAGKKIESLTKEIEELKAELKKYQEAGSLPQPEQPSQES